MGDLQEIFIGSTPMKMLVISSPFTGQISVTWAQLTAKKAGKCSPTVSVGGKEIGESIAVSAT